MGLQIQVRPNDKVYILLPGGEKIEITYIHRKNGNKVLDFTYPPIVEVHREVVYKRILKEGVNMNNQLTDEFLMEFLGRDTVEFSYALTPYEDRNEYERDKQLLNNHNNAAKPQDKFLIIHAAKVQRTDKEVLGI